MRNLLFTPFILFISSLSLFAATHVVDVSAPGSTCTTGDNTYTNIQDALDAVANNDEIIICDGAYNESVSRDASISGVTIKSFSEDKTTVIINGGSNRTFDLENFSNLTLQNLTISSTGKSSIRLLETTGDNNLENLDLSADDSYKTVEIQEGTGGYNLSLNNLNIENGDYGVYLVGVKTLTADTINFNNIDTDALYIKSTLDTNAAHTLSNINIQNNGADGIVYFSGNDIASLTMTNIVIGAENNVVGGDAISFKGGNSNLTIDTLEIYAQKHGIYSTAEGNYDLANINMPQVGLNAGKVGLYILDASSSSPIHLESINIGSSSSKPQSKGIWIDGSGDIIANNLDVYAEDTAFWSEDSSGEIEILNSRMDSADEHSVQVEAATELLISGSCLNSDRSNTDGIFLDTSVNNATIKQNYLTSNGTSSSFALDSRTTSSLLVYENCFQGKEDYLASSVGTHAQFDNGNTGNYWEHFNLNTSSYTDLGVIDNYPLVGCPIDPVTCTFSPVYQASDECGIFDNVLTSYDSILSGSYHPQSGRFIEANNDEAINTDSIAYPEGSLVGDIDCTINGTTASCNRNDPPENRLDFSVYPSSKLGTTESTPSGALTEVEYGDFNGNFNLTLEPASTYGTNTPVMLLGDVTLDGSSTLSLKAGDYFFNSLTFSGNNPYIVLADSASTRIFIKTNFIVTSNGLNVNLNGNPNNLFVYVRGDIDFQTNGNVETLNGFFYVEGEAKFDANSANFEVHGGITAEGKITISGQNGQFHQDSDASDLGHGACTYGTIVYTGGPFGAWDTVRHNASNPPSDQNISTKIVNKTFDLSLASLDDTGAAYALKALSPVDVAIYDSNSNIQISETSYSFDSNATSTATFTDINLTSASQDAIVGFKFCSTYEGNGTVGSDKVYILYPTASCSGSNSNNPYECDYETSATPVWRVCAAVDHFAARPDRLSLNTTHPHMPNLLRAGSDYNVTIQAHDFDTDNNTSDYNTSDSNISINTTYWLNTSPITENGIGAILPSSDENASLEPYTITDGVSTLTAFSYDEVGFITVSLRDQNWSDIDSDDTPATCDSNGSYICGDQNVTFIPHHFGFNAINITNSDGVAGSFTYIANLDTNDNSTYDITGRIGVTITAENELNVTTVNFDFNSTFYENNTSVSGSVFHNNHGNAQTTAIATSSLGFVEGVKTLNWNDANLSQVLRFNFNRTPNNPLNPFDINASDVNLSLLTTYTQTPVANYDSNAEINGTMTGLTGAGLNNTTATFIYGKTNAPRSRFQANDNQQVFIYYEAYCDGTDSAGVDCNTSLLPSDTDYTNDPRWFINNAHVATAGTAGSVNQKSFAINDGRVTEDAPGPHLNNVNITYDGTKNNPYKTTMENNASSWLIYNKFNANASKNEFEVEFEGGSSEWAGESNTTVTTDGNITVKVNRRSMW